MNLINMIDDYLISSERRKRESHYPSDVSKCLRQLYYTWTGEDESNPIPAGGFWKMRMGDKIHALIYEFMNNAGFQIENEISFKQDIKLKYPISGRIDNVFLDERGLSGLEVKTSYGRGIRALKEKQYPRESDVEQVICYMACSNIEKFYILYVARDDGYRMQFEIHDGHCFFNGIKKPLHTNFESIVEKLARLEKAVENRSIPGRDYQVAIKGGEIKTMFQKNNVKYKTDWQCGYCRWLDKCWYSEKQKYKNSDNSEVLKLREDEDE